MNQILTTRDSDAYGLPYKISPLCTVKETALHHVASKGKRPPDPVSPPHTRDASELVLVPLVPTRRWWSSVLRLLSRITTLLRRSSLLVLATLRRILALGRISAGLTAVLPKETPRVRTMLLYGLEITH
jgi:hypothetical protein